MASFAIGGRGKAMVIRAIIPRLIRFKDAPNYLGMDKNRFNKEVRPFVKQIPIGKQGVAFDRIDLDDWVDHYSGRVTRPINLRGELWDENDKNQKRQGCSVEAMSGTLTKKSLDAEYVRLLGLPITKKQKPSWHGESKTQGKQ